MDNLLKTKLFLIIGFIIIATIVISGYLALPLCNKFFAVDNYQNNNRAPDPHQELTFEDARCLQGKCISYSPCLNYIDIFRVVLLLLVIIYSIVFIISRLICHFKYAESQSPKK